MSVELFSPVQQHEFQSSQPVHELLTDAGRFLTNLPPTVDLFCDGIEDITTDAINPRDLDKLAVGDYSIWFADSDQVEPYVLARSINLRNGSQGPVIDTASWAPHQNQTRQIYWTHMSENPVVLKLLGYEFSDNNDDLDISAVPTPQTLKKAAAKMGVNVVFFEEYDIKSPQYLGELSQGNYSVSYANYEHDISEDHLLAFTLCGDALKLGLQAVANKALLLDRPKQNLITKKIDYFTGMLSVLLCGLHSSWAAKLSDDIQILNDVGGEIGLDQNTVDQILLAGGSKAEALGVSVPGLNPSTITGLAVQPVY